MSDQLSIDQLATELSGSDAQEQPEDQDSEGVENEQEADESASETEGDEPQGDDTEGDAEAEQPEKDSVKLVELTLDGEKGKLSLDEVKNGYLRQADFTQKTQNLARERQEAQARDQQDFQNVQAMGD